MNAMPKPSATANRLLLILVTTSSFWHPFHDATIERKIAVFPEAGVNDTDLGASGHKQEAYRSREWGNSRTFFDFLKAAFSRAPIQWAVAVLLLMICGPLTASRSDHFP
jgi:hypothetical protein